MLNIIDLEKRWLRYKLKSYIPHATIASSILIILSIILIYTTQEDVIVDRVEKPLHQNLIVQSESITIAPIEKIETEPIYVEPKPIVVKKQLPLARPQYKEVTQVKLSPSLDFMKKMQDSRQPYYKNEPTNGRSRTVRKETSATKKVIKTRAAPKQVKQDPVAIKKIQIKRQNTQNDIFEIIERFKKNNNPALSLFVAKKYYELGEYKQSYNYALITNQINKNIESSWIIFSKSLVKLGKRNKAIKTLQKYIKQSHSNAARILLDEIRSGKFR